MKHLILNLINQKILKHSFLQDNIHIKKMCLEDFMVILKLINLHLVYLENEILFIDNRNKSKTFRK